MRAADSAVDTDLGETGYALPGDVFSVRSVIQRLRRKLREAGAPVRIESVRGFGFQLIPMDEGAAPHLQLARAADP